MEAELHPTELSRQEQEAVDEYEAAIGRGEGIEVIDPDVRARYREIKESGR